MLCFFEANKSAVCLMWCIEISEAQFVEEIWVFGVEQNHLFIEAYSPGEIDVVKEFGGIG